MRPVSDLTPRRMAPSLSRAALRRSLAHRPAAPSEDEILPGIDRSVLPAHERAVLM